MRYIVAVFCIIFSIQIFSQELTFDAGVGIYLESGFIEQDLAPPVEGLLFKQKVGGSFSFKLNYKLKEDLSIYSGLGLASFNYNYIPWSILKWPTQTDGMGGIAAPSNVYNKAIRKIYFSIPLGIETTLEVGKKNYLPKSLHKSQFAHHK